MGITEAISRVIGEAKTVSVHCGTLQAAVMNMATIEGDQPSTDVMDRIKQLVAFGAIVKGRSLSEGIDLYGKGSAYRHYMRPYRTASQTQELTK